MIVELKDRLGKHTTTSAEAFIPANNTIEQDALIALTSLGIARPAAEAALKKAARIEPGAANLEELIRLSLKNM